MTKPIQVRMAAEALGPFTTVDLHMTDYERGDSSVIIRGYAAFSIEDPKPQRHDFTMVLGVTDTGIVVKSLGVK